MLDKPLTYSPGTVMCYSNFGYNVLGRVIELKSSQSYGDYMTSNVFQKVGSPRAVLGKTLITQEDEVRYYDFPGSTNGTSIFNPHGPLVPSPYGQWSLEVMDSHGAWIMSPVDLVRFQEALVARRTPNGPLLNSTYTDQIFAKTQFPSCNSGDNGTTPAQTTYWYGFGLLTNMYGNHWHDGSLPGTMTLDIMSADGYSFSLFTNTRPNSGDFENEFFDAAWHALGAVQAMPTPFGPATTDFYASFDGAYSEWQSFTDFNTTFYKNALQNNMFPLRIEGAVQNGQFVYRTRYGTFPQSPYRLIAAYVGLDCTQFQALNVTLVQRGFQLVSLQSFIDRGGVRRYQGSWLLLSETRPSQKRFDGHASVVFGSGY